MVGHMTPLRKPRGGWRYGISIPVLPISHLAETARFG
jgi:hypothetical protein